MIICRFVNTTESFDWHRCFWLCAVYHSLSSNDCACTTYFAQTILELAITHARSSCSPSCNSLKIQVCWFYIHLLQINVKIIMEITKMCFDWRTYKKISFHQKSHDQKSNDFAWSLGERFVAEAIQQQIATKHSQKVLYGERRQACHRTNFQRCIRSACDIFICSP